MKTIGFLISKKENEKRRVLIPDDLINTEMTAIAWEEMSDNGRTVFWRNNEIAGKLASFMHFHIMGDYHTNVLLQL